MNGVVHNFDVRWLYQTMGKYYKFITVLVYKCNTAFGLCLTTAV